MRTLPSFLLALPLSFACTGSDDVGSDSPNESTPLDSPTDSEADGEITWEQARPIIEARCSRCHSADRLCTYRRLETHQEVAALAPRLLDKLDAEPRKGLRMPVAFDHSGPEGCTPDHTPLNSKQLSDAERATLVAYLERTDHQDYVDPFEPLSAPVVPALAGAESYVSSWFEVLNDGFLEDPDGGPEDYMEEYGYDQREYDQMEDDWFCIRFDPARTEAGYLTGAQVETDSGQIFLNAQLLIDTTGASATAQAAADEKGEDWYRCDAGLGFSDAIPLWRTVPGGAAVELPEATGLRFQPGWTFVLRVDFHTHFDREEFLRLDQNGVIDDEAGTMTWFDQATLRATWASPSEITRELDLVVVEPTTAQEREDFAVPPGETTLRYTAQLPLEEGEEVAVFSAEVGMGKNGRTASLSDATNASCITSNGDFSPKWIEHALYGEGAAPTLTRESELTLQCTYRNGGEESVSWGPEGEATVWGRKERCSAVVWTYPIEGR